MREFLLCFENAISFLIGQAGLGEGRLREDARLPGKFEVKDQDSKVSFLLGSGKSIAHPRRNETEERPPDSGRALSLMSRLSLLSRRGAEKLKQEA